VSWSAASPVPRIDWELPVFCTSPGAVDGV
jgi:hypothetical protein